MTRALFLVIAALGVAPAVLLALVNLVAAIVPRFFRPISVSLRLFGRRGSTYDLGPALHLSAATTLLIIVGSVLLFAGIARIRPETPLSQNPPPSSTPR
jgi:hypothetical protein